MRNDPALFSNPTPSRRALPMTINAGSHRTGQDFLTTLTPAMVSDAPDPVRAFADYAQQVLGMPWATTKDLVVLRQRLNDLFDRYPQVNYYTLCRLVSWCKAKKIRKPRVWVLVDDPFRQMWAAGELPELDTLRHDPDVERRIRDALTVESNPYWRRRLIGSQGVGARRAALAAWLDAHA